MACSAGDGIETCPESAIVVQSVEPVLGKRREKNSVAIGIVYMYTSSIATLVFWFSLAALVDGDVHRPILRIKGEHLHGLSGTPPRPNMDTLAWYISRNFTILPR